MQQQLQCINCGSPYTFGQQFCASCGNAIHYECPRCHSQVPPGARFCSQCATDLSSAFQQNMPSRITFDVLPNPPLNTYPVPYPANFQNPVNNALPIPPANIYQNSPNALPGPANNAFPNTPFSTYQNSPIDMGPGTPQINAFPGQNQSFLPEPEKQIELPVEEKKENRSNYTSSRPWLIALVITVLIIVMLFGVGTCYK
jgi:hypothetical protein